MGFNRFGTATPMKVLKEVKGVKQATCGKCGKLVNSDSLVAEACKKCQSKELKK